MGTWKINLLGGFSILAPDGTPVMLPGKKHQALVAFLVCSRRGTVSRANVMELLWGFRSDGQARASLRGVLSEIKNAFRPHGEVPVAADRNRIYLTGVPVEVDVTRLTKAARADSVSALQAAADGYAGDFLATLRIREEHYLEWREREQFRFRKAYSRILTKLLGALCENGAHDDRIEDVANQLLALNGADEDAHRSLMVLYARQGNPPLALQQFKTCQRQLSSLGAAPSPETIRLVESIRATGAPDGAAPAAYEPARGAVAGGGSPPAFGTSVAIMPFASMNAGFDEADHGALLAEEIIGAAARFKWFRVVPRSESFRDQVDGGSAREVSEATGAKYVLEGRLREHGDDYRLGVDLIDCNSCSTVWTETLGLSRAELTDRKRTVARLTSQLEAQLLTREIEQAHRVDRDALSSYECTLLAISNMYDLRPGNYEEAETLFGLAVARKPDHAAVYSFWSLWKIWCFGQGWGDERGTELADAGRLARTALERDPSDALALAISGHYESFCNKDFDRGAILFEQSLARNPYSAFVWMLSSATCSYQGSPEEALRRLDHCDALGGVGPHLEFMYSCARSIAYVFAHDFERACEWGQKTVGLNGGFTNGYKQLLVALGQLEREEESRRYLCRLLELEPQFNVQTFIDRYPIAREADKEIFLEGLIKAGVPREFKVKRPTLAVVDRR